MALQKKKIMPPPWLAHREIERYSIGWRMGYGEDYIYRFGDWLDTLSPDERTEYRTLFPEPVTWKGWWMTRTGLRCWRTVTSGWMRGSRKVGQVHPAVAPAGVYRWEKAGILLILGPSACPGRQYDEKLPQPVVDGGFLVHR